MGLLPDCRTKTAPVGISRGVAGTWLPVYCANCGSDGGLVPEENMTFIFYLCNPCAETHGQIANTLMMPDEVFWARVVDEQYETYGRLLAPQELQAVYEANMSPLATLLRERI